MRHEWTADGRTYAAGGFPFLQVKAPNGTWQHAENELAIQNEILRLAKRDYEHEIFTAELIGRLGLVREAMELSEIPIGNQLLEIVEALAARVRELEAAPDGLVAYNYITEGHRRLREALQAARLWRPREDGQGGAIDCAVEALARLAVLEEENARLRAAFPDLEMLRRADRLEEDNRRLRERLGEMVYTTTTGKIFPALKEDTNLAELWPDLPALLKLPGSAA